MKRIMIVIATVLCFLPFVFGSLNVPQDAGRVAPLSTIQERAWYAITVDSNTSARDANDQSSWTDCLSLCYPIKPSWNGVILSFYGYGDGDGTGDPNDGSFKYDVYVCGLYTGLKCVSVNNSATVGCQRLSHNPSTGAELYSGTPDPNYCWVDTITEGTSRWATNIKYLDYEGTNGLAETSFDRRNNFGIWVRIYDKSALTSVTWVLTGY